MIKFPYGEILPPLHGQLGTFGAPGQNTICIPKKHAEQNYEMPAKMFLD